jgi:hypothetical protein
MDGQPANQAVAASEGRATTTEARPSQRPVLQKRRRRRARAPPGVLAFTVAEFCRQHSISEALFFKLQAQGSGPETMKVGGRRLISIEAAARWRRSRETAA